MDQATNSSAGMTDGKITRQLLKMRSGEFDLESIHSMILREMGISDLGCIGECTGLERLDLSRNDISKLYNLASLSSLAHLNLSANRISSLEGLQSLDNLKTVNLAGNLLGSIDTLHCLAGLEKLEELRLKDDIHELTNPICMRVSYREDVLQMFPKLLILDGERLKGKGSELYKLCAEIDRDLAESICHAGPVKEIPMPTAWVPKGYWDRSEEKKREDLAIEDAEKQLTDLIAECKRLNSVAEDNLNGMVNRLAKTDTSS
ncbi:leucine-rich repeat-containing protein 61-like [Lineus longissimus]|uniref:leucine-rich repeat-containing protein 61-like n=1 Tax=Lineus longissimus TaxID=88925 RepID=UPI002B4E8C82